MTDLPVRLQDALGDAYHLEREMGGGGMSRLFVATERSLNRQVVVKVLPPELTSEVSAARFKQEIEVAAKLQHPHIVPILGAGASGDLLYYIMPYVRGESLRHRLVASGKLPVDDAVRILAEVSRALGHAHRQGIVHRDIKPENILLEDGQAVLADFGVARAIVAARASGLGADDSRPEKITGTGMAVGTPTYMAPEQAAGESTVDARADLYALAVVGYEMLTGQHPFAATSAQKMIVAHLTLPAPPVAKLRPETPVAVSAAIARALAKEPEERFETAEDFRAALSERESRPPKMRRPMLALAGIVVLLAVAVALLYVRRNRSITLDRDLVVVAPFDVVDPDLRLWREGMVDVLSRNLDGAGPLRTVPTVVAMRQWSGHGDRSSAAKLGIATGARYSIFGGLVRAGTDSVKGSALIVDAQSGKLLGEVERSELTSRMGRLADSLTIDVLRVLGREQDLAGVRISSVGTTSLSALKAFLQGEQFFRRSEWDSASAYYERAVDADSLFGVAFWRLSDATGWLSPGDDSTPLEYAARSIRLIHNLSPRDSLLMEANAAFRRLQLLDNSSESFYDMRALQLRLFSTLAEAVRRYPNEPLVWNGLGEAQMHWGYGAGVGVTPRDILRSFDRAIALDSAFAPAYVHAITLGFRFGTESGRRYLAGALAAQPARGEAEGLRLAYLLTDPGLPRASRRAAIDSATLNQLATAAEELREWSDSDETNVLIARTLAAKAASAGGADSLEEQWKLAFMLANRGHGVEAERLFPNGILDAELALVGAIPRSRADSVYLSQLPLSCHVCALILRGTQGDTTGVRAVRRLSDSLDKIQSAPPQQLSDLSVDKVADAYITLGRHDTSTALSLFLALPDSGCHVGCIWLKLTKAQLLESRGRYAEAGRLLDNTGELTIVSAVVSTLLELERGRIAERLNDTTRARLAYSYVADIWQRGEPPFQSYVSEARAGLERLATTDKSPRIDMKRH